MEYKYFYHVRVERSWMKGADFMEQLRNEPLTAQFYRDALRWALSDCCPWNFGYDLGAGSVRCVVFRLCGCFTSIPSGDEHIYEEDMERVASFCWDRYKDDIGYTLVKSWTNHLPNGVNNTYILDTDEARRYNNDL